jgi:hypothetical protein
MRDVAVLKHTNRAAQTKPTNNHATERVLMMQAREGRECP